MANWVYELPNAPISFGGGECAVTFVLQQAVVANRCGTFSSASFSQFAPYFLADVTRGRREGLPPWPSCGTCWYVYCQRLLHSLAVESSALSHVHCPYNTRRVGTENPSLAFKGS